MKPLIIIIFTVVLLAKPAMAQEPTSGPSPRLKQLTQDYLFQASTYQTAKDQFDLDKAEYKQLQTLVSREKVVASYKVMAKTRAATQLAYLSAIEQVLAETAGVDPAEKTKIFELLNQSRALLSNHETELASIVDPQQINDKAKEIRESMTFVYKTQYSILSLIALSRVEHSYESIVALTNTFEQTNVTAQPNSGLKDFLSRGVNDVKQQNAQSQAVIEKSGLAYTRLFTEEIKNPSQALAVYNQVTKELQPFLKFSNQSLRYLRELERQVIKDNGSN